ncbi:MAG: hypothetical protein WB806_22115 [Xanthobacteraceae bacterium]
METPQHICGSVSLVLMKFDYGADSGCPTRAGAPMAAENLNEVAHQRATPGQEGVRVSHQSFAEAPKQQSEYKGLMTMGYLLLAALVLLVHLLVSYRS